MTEIVADESYLLEETTQEEGGEIDGEVVAVVGVGSEIISEIGL